MKKLQEEINYKEIVSPDNICFEIIKDLIKEQKKDRVVNYLLTTIIALFIITGAYILTHYEISSTTVNENASFGGDFNNYNDNSQDSREYNIDVKGGNN